MQQSTHSKAFDDSVKEEIRSAINIVDVVGRHVSLKPAGQNFKGLCPFHKEKTPSFTVSPSKGIFYCFGCHKGGDVFSFLMEMEGLTFPEAMRLLADEAGVKLAPRRAEPAAQPGDGGAQAPAISKTDLLSINQMACDFYYRQTRDHKPAIDYFLSRGLTRETIREFRLGYAPDDWTAFINYAKSKGIAEQQLVHAGLAVVKQDTGGAYDRFRDRIIFPIFDMSKRPVGFAGRGLTADATPKYLNSPETPLYQKSKILYGFHVTHQHVRESKSAIIVEGYMDFLALFQAGIKNVIAASGTAFTDAHARTLRRFTARLYLVFDGDAAGIEAARRAVFVLAPYNFDIRVLIIPNDEDPDEVINKHGAKKFLEMLTGAQDYMKFIIEKVTGDHDTTTPTGTSAALDSLVQLSLTFSDSEIRRKFRKQISEALSIPEETVYYRIKQFQNPSLSRPPQSPGDIPAAYFGTIEGKFIWFLLTNPSLIPEARQFILPETFSDQFSGKLYSIILKSFDENPHLDTLLRNVDDEETKRLISYAFTSGAPGENIKDDLIHIMKRLQEKFIMFQKKANEELMKKDPSKRRLLTEKNRNLLLQLKELAGQ